MNRSKDLFNFVFKIKEFIDEIQIWSYAGSELYGKKNYNVRVQFNPSSLAISLNSIGMDFMNPLTPEQRFDKMLNYCGGDMEKVKEYNHYINFLSMYESEQIIGCTNVYETYYASKYLFDMLSFIKGLKIKNTCGYQLLIGARKETEDLIKKEYVSEINELKYNLSKQSEDINYLIQEIHLLELNVRRKIKSGKIGYKAKGKNSYNEEKLIYDDIIDIMRAIKKINDKSHSIPQHLRDDFISAKKELQN